MLDPMDIAIIEILQQDGRLAISKLGNRIGLSQPATSERVRRLEERGVIGGYRAEIVIERLGLGLTAIISLRTTPEQIPRCLKQFSEMPQVIEVHRVTGEYCFLLKVIVPSPARLEHIVDAVARFGSVTTALVLRSEPPKPITGDLLKLGIGIA